MPDFVLPLNMIGRAEVSHAEREVIHLDEVLRQINISGKSSGQTFPPTSQILAEFSKANNLDIYKPSDRDLLQQHLVYIKTHAPYVHASFASDPPLAAVQKILAWMRREVNPMILMQIGLQPGIGGGCILRTTNKYFDLSLRRFFNEHSELLTSQLRSKSAEIK